MSQGNYVFSPEELLQYKRQPSQLPQRGGPKDFAPDGTYGQAHRLQRMLREYESILKEQRVAKKGTVSVGRWNTERKVAEITTEKHFGKKIAGQMELLPEEALYLIEQGSLELFHEGLPLPFQQAHAMLLPHAFPFEHYLVYSYLLRLGFIVLRHKSRITPRHSVQQGHTPDPEVRTRSNKRAPVEANSPLLTSPVSNLWTDNQGCTPLVRPSDAVSTASILSKLQIVKTHRMRDSTREAETSEAVAFDVYQPGVHFRKTNPGPPCLCICVCKFSSPLPSLATVARLTQDCLPVPLTFAVVDGGSVSFYSFLDVDTPTYITN